MALALSHTSPESPAIVLPEFPSPVSAPRSLPASDCPHTLQAICPPLAPCAQRARLPISQTSVQYESLRIRDNSTFAIAFVLRLAFARRAGMRDRKLAARACA